MAAIEKWWFVSVVDRTSGTIVRMDIDGVVSETTSGALHAAANRNPLRQHEVFAVRKATGVHGIRCRECSNRRTKQLVEFVEFMTQ